MCLCSVVHFIERTWFPHTVCQSGKCARAMERGSRGCAHAQSKHPSAHEHTVQRLAELKRKWYDTSLSPSTTTSTTCSFARCGCGPIAGVKYTHSRIWTYHTHTAAALVGFYCRPNNTGVSRCQRACAQDTQGARPEECLAAHRTTSRHKNM